MSFSEWRQCGDPGTPNNGYRIGSSFHAGNLISYLCNDGYTLVGPVTILCQWNGRWTQNKPLCKLYIRFIWFIMVNLFQRNLFDPVSVEWTVTQKRSL